MCVYCRRSRFSHEIPLHFCIVFIILLSATNASNFSFVCLFMYVPAGSPSIRNSCMIKFRTTPGNRPCFVLKATSHLKACLAFTTEARTTNCACFFCKSETCPYYDAPPLVPRFASKSPSWVTVIFNLKTKLTGVIELASLTLACRTFSSRKTKQTGILLCSR